MVDKYVFKIQPVQIVKHCKQLGASVDNNDNPKRLVNVNKLIDMKVIRIINTIIFIGVFVNAFGQGSINFSIPFIINSVRMENNWSPPTAINRKKYFNGTSLAYGANLTYSFRPNSIIKNENMCLLIGIGYFKQRFDIERPFNYDSPLQPIFYTDHYSYHCLQTIIGIGHKYPIKDKFHLSSNLLYSWLNSFRQDYTPTSNHGYGKLTQTNNSNINFGHTILLEFGAYRQLNSKLSSGLNILVPLYTRWRNDIIFNDNPSEFSNPKFSVGLSLSTTYRL